MSTRNNSIGTHGSMASAYSAAMSGLSGLSGAVLSLHLGPVVHEVCVAYSVAMSGLSRLSSVGARAWRGEVRVGRVGVEERGAVA